MSLSRTKSESLHTAQGRVGAANMAHPEVLGVHMQFLTVQLGQLGVGALDVVQVLDGFPEGGEHLLAMGTDLGVANDGRGAGQVPKVVKEPLGPGVDDQQPGQRHDTHRHVSAAVAAVLSLCQCPPPVTMGRGSGLWL
uniref:Uncharacterized protein n=1 Tax=Malurus cyaneus samueli TaxID=2593467 RepID=A0A8C5T7K2_9PASS